MRLVWCLYSSGFHSVSICWVCCVPGTILIIEGGPKELVIPDLCSCSSYSFIDMHVGIVGPMFWGRLEQYLLEFYINQVIGWCTT